MLASLILSFMFVCQEPSFSSFDHVEPKKQTLPAKEVVKETPQVVTKTLIVRDMGTPCKHCGRKQNEVPFKYCMSARDGTFFWNNNYDKLLKDVNAANGFPVVGVEVQTPSVSIQEQISSPLFSLPNPSMDCSGGVCRPRSSGFSFGRSCGPGGCR